MHTIILRRQKDARKQAGDTIVEVMIVLAVLGMAIGISYATANRSLLNSRQAQEASLATELVQSQVESLKQLAGDPAIYTTSPAFCITTAAGTPSIFPLSSAQIANPPTNLPTNCQMGEANRYGMIITQPSAGTFNARAYWDDVEGQGVDTATMLYRLPQTQPNIGGVVGGGGGGGGGIVGGGATVPPTLTVINKQCRVAVTTGIGVGSQNNNADLVVTGTPSTTVTVHTAIQYTWFLGPLTDTRDYSIALDSSGNGTQHVSYNGYINLTSWVATATDSSGNSTASVQVCP